MTTFDTVAKDAMLASVRDRLHTKGGVLEVYAGLIPGALDADLSNHVKLASKSLGLPTFAQPNGGTMHAMLASGDIIPVLADGVVGFYRVVCQGVPVLLSTAGQASACSLRVALADVQKGTNLQISGWMVEAAQ